MKNKQCLAVANSCLLSLLLAFFFTDSETQLRCLSTVFSGPYQTFSFGRLANFPDSDRCEIYTRYWNWIEVSYDTVFGKIDISMVTINRKTRYQLNLNSTRIRFDVKILTPVSETMVYCTSNTQE